MRGIFLCFGQFGEGMTAGVAELFLERGAIEVIEPVFERLARFSNVENLLRQRGLT